VEIKNILTERSITVNPKPHIVGVFYLTKPNNLRSFLYENSRVSKYYINNIPK
jgi:hypothetical protein